MDHSGMDHSGMDHGSMGGGGANSSAASSGGGGGHGSMSHTPGTCRISVSGTAFFFFPSMHVKKDIYNLYPCGG